MRADGRPVAIRRGQRHRRRLGNLGADRFAEPALELLHRIAVDVALVERGAMVLPAEIGDVQRDGRGGRRAIMAVRMLRCTHRAFAEAHAIGERETPVTPVRMRDPSARRNATSAKRGFSPMQHPRSLTRKSTQICTPRPEDCGIFAPMERQDR